MAWTLGELLSSFCILYGSFYSILGMAIYDLPSIAWSIVLIVLGMIALLFLPSSSAHEVVNRWMEEEEELDREMQERYEDGM